MEEVSELLPDLLVLLEMVAAELVVRLASAVRQEQQTEAAVVVDPVKAVFNLAELEVPASSSSVMPYQPIHHYPT